MKISGVIIAFNEEAKIYDAVRTLDWADEVLVIDAESTDGTKKIAEELGAHVITRPWPGFSAQKQFGMDSASYDWIFSLDADERVTPELREEILAVKERSAETNCSGYRIPRLAYYMERPIWHSGWYPDWQLRLFDRRRGRWKNVLIHESVEMDRGAKVEKLHGNILHYSMDGPADHNEMIAKRYAPLAARQMFEKGRRTDLLKIVAAGPIAFISTYVLKAGFLDGLPGYCIARFAAHHAFLKHLYLRELQNGRSLPY